MVSFKQFLIEQETKVPKLPWNGTPDIGWWRDGKVLRTYHGTNFEHLESISVSGLDRLDAKTGMISMALEPFTARAFAVMGGEARFLGAGAKAKVVPQEKRITLVFDLPQSFVSKYEDPDLRGNDPLHLRRLRERELYDEFDGIDQQYYQLCELRLSTAVPAKYLVGYMVK